jgi:hypothetical protein
MTIHIKSTKTASTRGQQRCRFTALFVVAFSYYCFFQIESVKCLQLDTIVKDSEYSEGIEIPNDSLVIDYDIGKQNDLENNMQPPNSHQGTSLEDNVINDDSTTTANQYLDRLWGSSGTGSTTVPSKTEAADDHRTNEIERTEGIRAEGKHHPGRWGSTQQQANMPMKGKFLDGHINPPEGFTITARVYIDTNDKLAHFDVIEEANGEVNSTSKSNHIMLPYYDCGVSGATTAALPVKQIHFRHALSSPTTVYVDQSSIDSKLVLYPVLAIALSSLRVELDSGAHMDFVAGDAILFEDTIRPGHLLTVSKESKNLTVLLITLPNKHHHIGKQYISIKAALKTHSQKSIPCIVSQASDDSDKERMNYKHEDPEFATISMTDASLNTSSILLTSPDGFIDSSPALFSDAGRRIRIVILGTIAFSLSTLMADFLGRTAPLWLAVGVGGTCFVLGSTYAITIFSEFLYTSISLWHERRKLENTSSQSVND